MQVPASQAHPHGADSAAHQPHGWMMGNPRTESGWDSWGKPSPGGGGLVRDVLLDVDGGEVRDVILEDGCKSEGLLSGPVREDILEAVPKLICDEGLPRLVGGDVLGWLRSRETLVLSTGPGGASDLNLFLALGLNLW